MPGIVHCASCGAQQAEIKIGPQWGGRRPGAGRKRKQPVIRLPVPDRIAASLSALRGLTADQGGPALWYCAQVTAGRELAALGDVLDLGLVAMAPRRLERARDGRAVMRLMWPGYLLIRLGAALELAHVIRVRDVVRLLPSSDCPAPARPGELERIIARTLADRDGASDREPLPELADLIGLRVAIDSGPFASCHGTVEAVQHDAAKVSIPMLGRNAILTIDRRRLAPVR